MLFKCRSSNVEPTCLPAVGFWSIRVCIDAGASASGLPPNSLPDLGLESCSRRRRRRHHFVHAVAVGRDFYHRKRGRPLSLSLCSATAAIFCHLIPVGGTDRMPTGPPLSLSLHPLSTKCHYYSQTKRHAVESRSRAPFWSIGANRAGFSYHLPSFLPSRVSSSRHSVSSSSSPKGRQTDRPTDLPCHHPFAWQQWQRRSSSRSLAGGRSGRAAAIDSMKR